MESVTVSAGNRRGVKLPVWGHSPEILIWRNRLWFLREAERGVSVRGTVPLVIPGVIPAPMQRVADATQVTADPTQPRANYSSPPASHPQGPPLALWPRFAFQGRPDASPQGSRAGRSVLKAPLGQAKRRRDPNGRCDVVPEEEEAGEGDELDLQSFLEGVSEDDPELLRIMPSFTMPSFGALRTFEDADRARAAASSDSALDLL